MVENACVIPVDEAWCSLNAPPRNLSQAGEPGREKQPFPRPSKSQHPTITRQTTAETYSLVASYDESGGRLHSATSNEVREVFVLGNEVTMSLGKISSIKWQV